MRKFLMLCVMLVLSLTIGMAAADRKPPKPNGKTDYAWIPTAGEYGTGVYKFFQYYCSTDSGKHLRLVTGKKNSLMEPSPGKILVTQWPANDRLNTDNTMAMMGEICTEELGEQGHITGFDEVVPASREFGHDNGGRGVPGSGLYQLPY